MAADWLETIQKGYDCKGDALFLGAGLRGGACDKAAVIQLPLAMLNRHGLVTGATGTGKTKTLQAMAEQLSEAGVPVFLADLKGDLSGLAQAGEANPKLDQRAADLGVKWRGSAFPVEFYSLTGGKGAPLRAAMSSFGPLLLAKALALSDTQASALAMVFKFCDDHGLLLLDLKDLKAALQYLAGEGKEALKEYGLLSTATAGVLLRELLKLEAQGAADFFGEPQLELDDLLRKGADGRGVVSILELSDVEDRPALFSTFLMWLLARLFHELPEVGDAEKPKLVFFFDEAHLLFDGASKEFLDEVQRVIRLIRSKGVGVFFVTQTPKDVPPEVLAQLGARVQHALRAFTPNDQKALKFTVQTFPETPFYDLEELLPALAIGEAVVTVLNEAGAPTPVAACRMAPPRSRMAPCDEAVMKGLIANSSLAKHYAQAVDRESAYEVLAARHAQPPVPGGSPEAAGTLADEAAKFKSLPPPAAPAARTAKEAPTAAEKAGGWLMKEAGRQVGRALVRGAVGVLLGGLLGSAVRRRR